MRRRRPTRVKVWVINLARHTERRRNVEAQLAPLGVDYAFFEAVEGSAGFDYFAGGRRAPPERNLGE